VSRILVTGATGGLGSALVHRLLDDAAEVSALVLPGERLGGVANVRDRVELRFGDLRDRHSLERAFRGADVVYNVAGVAVPLDRLHHQMVAVNVDGARNVAEAAARAGVRRLVHTSSTSAIGYPPAGEVADETFDVSRSVCTNSYAITQTGGERALLEVASRRGLDAVVVNPSAVIAPYGHLGYGWAGFVRMAQRRQLRWHPPGGLALCAVEDLVEGQLAAAARGRPGERYILTTVNITHRDLFTLTCRLVGAGPPRRGVSARTVRAAGRAGWLVSQLRRDPARNPFLVPENAELAVHHLYYSAAKAQRELAFTPTSIDDSIMAVDAWLHERDDRVAAAA
jgi:dihydroflavonol-4-reductase